MNTCNANPSPAFATVDDVALQTKLQTLFRLNPYLALYQLPMEVMQGQVFLSGKVTHRAIGELAEDICRTVCEGKYIIRNAITVDPGCVGDIGNGWLLNRVRDLNTETGIKIKYALSRFTCDADVEVMVDSSRVVLTGNLINEEQAHQAVQIARDTYGVISVVDNMSAASNVTAVNKRTESLPASDELTARAAKNAGKGPDHSVSESQQRQNHERVGARRTAANAEMHSQVQDNVKIMLSLSMRLSKQRLKVLDYEKDSGLISLTGETSDEVTKKYMENLVLSICGVDEIDTHQVQVRSGTTS